MDPAERETEEEWRDPEDASTTTPIRGVLAKLQVLDVPTARRPKLNSQRTAATDSNCKVYTLQSQS